MPSIKVRVPHADRHALGEGVLSRTAKPRLAALLDELEAMPAPIEPPYSVPADFVTLWVSDEQATQLAALARAHGLDGSGPAASALLHAAARQAADSVAAPDLIQSAGALSTLDRINHALGNASRPDQVAFFTGLSKEVARRPSGPEVIFAEAATGIGKSRAFEALVIDWCESHEGERAVIAAPSYNILLQSISQWQRIEKVYLVPPWIVIAGQSEFVSREALKRAIDEHPDAPGGEAALAWLTGNGEAPKDDPMGHRWLGRSLSAATRGLWPLIPQVQLDSDTADDDPGKRAYLGQFVRAHESRVIFCTHAMLAVEVRYRLGAATKAFATSRGETAAIAARSAWEAIAEEDRKFSRTYELRNGLLRTALTGDPGRLPEVGLLIIDEGHQLEASFATVFASGISVSRLMRALRKLRETAPKSIRESDIERADAAWQRLREVGGLLGVDRVTTQENEAVSEAVSSLREIIGAVVKRIPKAIAHAAEVRHLRAISLALEVAARSLGERNGMTVRVSWSPAVHWPAIEVGRYDVSRELDFLWSAVVRDRSVVVSATLFDDVTLAGLENIRRMLSVRTVFVRALPPVRPAWLFDPVTLCLAGATVHVDGLPRYRRPVIRDKLDADEFARRSERWRRDVADYIVKAYASAVGGVLVLLTAYAEVDEIEARLAQTLPPELLLAQGPDRSLEALRYAFFERTAEGRKPLLLGVGAAWTGLDISADGLHALTGVSLSPAEDRVLTDLIMPIAPIGTNRSLTHAWRREKTGTAAEIGATSILFRQGIGRLVRRDGLPNNRRLHVLDSRIHEAAWAPFMRPLLRALEGYRRRLAV